MKPLTYVVEPIGLLLLWQPASATSHGLTRRVVGKVLVDDSGHVEFRYLSHDEDYAVACSQGFQGFPAFDTRKEVIREGVVEALLRRLPPRGREDFHQFLAQHGLPNPFIYSDLALLAYTGARLPSDGFCVVPIFPNKITQCDYVMEVAGIGYSFTGDITTIQPGDAVQFSVESSNKIDRDAVAIYSEFGKLGYVIRGLRHTFNDWLVHHNVTGSVFRVNGTSQRPRIFVQVNVR